MDLQSTRSQSFNLSIFLKVFFVQVANVETDKNTFFNRTFFGPLHHKAISVHAEGQKQFHEQGQQP